MLAKEKQVIKTISTSSKIDDVNHPSFKCHEQFQRTDNFLLYRKISNKPECSNSEDKNLISSTNLSSKSNDAISTEEIPTALFAIQNKSSIWKYDVIYDTQSTIESSISENNAIKHFGHVSWKYKNPYSVSINKCLHSEKSNLMSENILKEDEPQEGRTKRSVLSDCREYLANYQESCGTPRTEYSFAALIIVIAQTTARFLWALLYMLVNIAPVIQMFSFILRFVLDKMLNIRQTKNLQQVIVKFTILAVQLFSVYVCLIFIFGFIVFPIVQIAINIAIKLVMQD